MTTPEPAVDRGLPNGWRGPIADLDVPTSDNRMAATPPGGIRTRAYPLTLTLNHVNDPTGYPTIGNVERVWNQDGVMMGEGKLDINGPAGAEYARQLMEGMTNRVSIDPVEVVAEYRMLGPDGNYFDAPADGWTEEAFAALPEGTRPIMTFADWVLGGLAAVPIPAYSQAAIEPVWDYCVSSALPEDAIVAAVDVPMVDEGLTRGDAEFMDRMVRHHYKAMGVAAHYLASPSATHPEARRVAEESRASSFTAIMAILDAMATATPTPDALVAALPVGGQVFTKAFFEAKADGPTPPTITEDGHFYGHVRLNGTCYQYGGGQGRGKECTEPPMSACEYAKFMVHGAKMDDGSIMPVGAITFGEGHESRGGLQASRKHYDNVSYVAAKVFAEDDEWGTWVTGEIVDEYRDHAYDLLLAPMSGHWEPDADNRNYLEMLAAHIVVTPGYRPAARIVAAFDGEENVTGVLLTEDFTQIVIQEDEGIVASVRAEVVKAFNDAKRADELSQKIGVDVHLAAKAKADADAKAARTAQINSAFPDAIVSAAGGGQSVANPDTAWDGPGAASRMLDRATNSDGEINVGTAGQGFLAHVGDGSKRGDWKLPFADVHGGNLTIIPRGVSAAAGRLNQTQGVDQAKAASRIKGLYSRIHAKYPDWPAAPPA